MKRRLVLILLLLVGGVIVNIAVAWACGWLSPPDALKPVYGDSMRNRVIVPGMQVYSWECRGTGVAMLGVLMNERTTTGGEYQPLENVWPSWIALEDIRLDEYGNRYFRGCAMAQGWPLLALWCEYPKPTGKIEGGRELRRSRYPNSYGTWYRVIAFRPIWPHFAINTMFYALLWLLFTAPFALRRRRRIKHGLCPKCAYDLRNRPSDSTTCPECGTAVA